MRCFMRGTSSDCRPKSRTWQMERNLPEISHEINIVTLDFWWENKKAYLTLMWLWKSQKRFWITGYWYSDILLRGFPWWGTLPILRKAIRVQPQWSTRVEKVIENYGLRIATKYQYSRPYRVLRDYDFAHLLFGNGYVEQSISLEKQLNTIQVADWYPRQGTLWVNIPLWSFYPLPCWLSLKPFVFRLLSIQTESIFKIVDLDEAWSFLQVAQGKTLSMKLVRAGRAMNASIFQTQNTDDLLDENWKITRLVPGIRSTDLTRLKTLAFFGVDPEDENTRSDCVIWKNGQCLISDLYGRVGVMLCSTLEELLHAFDTRPPVRRGCKCETINR